MAFLWDDSVPQQTQKPVYFEDEADVTRYYPPVPEGVRRGLKPGGENVIRRAIADEAAAQQAEMQKQQSAILHRMRWLERSDETLAWRQAQRQAALQLSMMDSKDQTRLQERRARLRALIVAESKQFTDELAAMGLAVYNPY